jgi:hypothetical protein
MSLIGKCSKQQFEHASLRLRGLSTDRAAAANAVVRLVDQDELLDAALGDAGVMRSDADLLAFAAEVLAELAKTARRTAP